MDHDHTDRILARITAAWPTKVNEALLGEFRKHVTRLDYVTAAKAVSRMERTVGSFGPSIADLMSAYDAEHADQERAMRATGAVCPTCRGDHQLFPDDAQRLLRLDRMPDGAVPCPTCCAAQYAELTRSGGRQTLRVYGAQLDPDEPTPDPVAHQRHVAETRMALGRPGKRESLAEPEATPEPPPAEDFLDR